MTIHAAQTTVNDNSPEPAQAVHKQSSYKVITGVDIATSEDDSTEIDFRGFKSCMLLIPSGATVNNAITFFMHAVQGDGSGILAFNTTPAAITFTPDTANRWYDITSLVANLGSFRMQVASAAITGCTVYLEG